MGKSNKLPALQQALGVMNIAPTPIPQLHSHTLLGRLGHKMKLQDMAEIAELEAQIAANYASKTQSYLNAFSTVMNSSEALFTDRETIIDRRRTSNALALQEEAKAQLMQIEAMRERFEFEAWKKEQDED